MLAGFGFWVRVQLEQGTVQGRPCLLCVGFGVWQPSLRGEGVCVDCQFVDSAVLDFESQAINVLHAGDTYVPM